MVWQRSKLLSMKILYGCPLTRWQSCSREINQPYPDISKIFLQRVNCSEIQLLLGNGSVSHKQAVDKATEEYKKYKARTLSDVESDYLNSIKMLEQKTEKK